MRIRVGRVTNYILVLDVRRFPSSSAIPVTLDPGVKLFQEIGQESYFGLDLTAEICQHLAGFFE